MENTSERRIASVRTGMIIFLCFLLTGSAYISWLYHLTDLFGSFQADLLSEGVGYLFQATGIFLTALAVKHRPDTVKNRHCLNAAVLLDGILTAAAVLTSAKASVLVFGLLLNLMHGVIAGIYLIKLTLYVPQQNKCTIFGLAYGLGSIGTWVLSLPMDHGFLRSRMSLAVYLAVILIIILINSIGKPDTLSDDVNNSADVGRPDTALIAAAVVLLSVVKGLGFYFPVSQFQSGAVSLEFSRAFYAAGLIAAGIIGDRNRKYGAICCLAALIFPFISITLSDAPGASSALWILGYIFFGFFSVYRVAVFSDIAAKKNSLIWTAGFGLLFGRIGDAAGTMTGTLLASHEVLLITVSGVLFILTVILFFRLYHSLYVPVLTQKQNEEKLLSGFESQYSLSARECEVFRLAVGGRSNAEIAGDLYISESTVKFHMKNVLKKTGCANRSELAAKFRQL